MIEQDWNLAFAFPLIVAMALCALGGIGWLVADGSDARAEAVSTVQVGLLLFGGFWLLINVARYVLVFAVGVGVGVGKWLGWW